MADTIIHITCSQCGHVINMKQPGKPGLYQVVCPQCQHPLKLQLRAKPLSLEGSQEQGGQQDEQKQKVRLLTDIKPWKDGRDALRPVLPINTPFAFHCPTCENTVIFSLPKTGVLGVKCRHCSTLTFVKGISQEEQDKAQQQQADATSSQPAAEGEKSESLALTVRGGRKQQSKARIPAAAKPISMPKIPKALPSAVQHKIGATHSRRKLSR